MNSLNVAGTRKGLIPRSEQMVKERGLREGGGKFEILSKGQVVSMLFSFKLSIFLLRKAHGKFTVFHQ